MMWLPFDGKWKPALGMMRMNPSFRALMRRGLVERYPAEGAVWRLTDAGVVARKAL